MKLEVKRLTFRFFLLVAAASSSLLANTVTVQELGLGNGRTDIWISSSTLGNNLQVFAGIVNIKVEGANTSSFCIDPWHWSVSTPQEYNLVPLEDAPRSPGAMGPNAAAAIERLWYQFFGNAVGDSSGYWAAAMQIEIWKIEDAAISGGTFHLDLAPATVNAYVGVMETWLASNPGAREADLDAVIKQLQPSTANIDRPGQDYVIPRVPDCGSTVVLLGLGILGLPLLRRRLVG